MTAQMAATEREHLSEALVSHCTLRPEKVIMCSPVMGAGNGIRLLHEDIAPISALTWPQMQSNEQVSCDIGTFQESQCTQFKATYAKILSIYIFSGTVVLKGNVY